MRLRPPRSSWHAQRASLLVLVVHGVVSYSVASFEKRPKQRRHGLDGDGPSQPSRRARRPPPPPLATSPPPPPPTSSASTTASARGDGAVGRRGVTVLPLQQSGVTPSQPSDRTTVTTIWRPVSRGVGGLGAMRACVPWGRGVGGLHRSRECTPPYPPSSWNPAGREEKIGCCSHTLQHAHDNNMHMHMLHVCMNMCMCMCMHTNSDHRTCYCILRRKYVPWVAMGGDYPPPQTDKNNLQTPQSLGSPSQWPTSMDYAHSRWPCLMEGRTRIII